MERTMKMQTTHTVKRENFIPRFAGFLVSAATTISVFLSTVRYETDIQRSTWMFSAAILAFWTVILISSSGYKHYKTWEIFAYGVVFSLLSIYLLNTVWNNGYLTNDPIMAIADPTNRIHRDSLHHVAIVQGLLNYKVPSLLINSASFYNYHFGSHILFALLSWITDLNPYFSYCFLYPVVFFPLYIYFITSISIRAKLYFSGENRISLADAFFICWFVMPELPLSILYKSAVWKSSWIASESYFIAIVIMLFFLDIALAFEEEKWFSNTIKRGLFHIVLTPAFILIVSLSKISVGFLLTIGIMYFYFRMHTKEGYYWALNTYYGVFFLAVYFIPGMIKSSFSSATHSTYFELFSFYKNYVDRTFIPVHFIVLYFFAGILFVHCFAQKNCWVSIKKKEYVPEEILLLICVAGMAPGMIMNIIGGSAGYFLYPQQIIATLLIIARNIPKKMIALLRDKRLILRRVVVLSVIACVSLCLLVNEFHTSREFAGMMAKSALNHPKMSEYTDNPYMKTIREINDLTNHQKDKFYLYIDASATIWTDSPHQLFALLFYPALTGVIEIGTLYCEDNVPFCNNGEQYTEILYNPNPNDTKMTLNDALIRCQKDGKKALIYIYDDTMQVLPIEGE